MSWFRVTPDKSGAVTIGRYKEQLVREVAFPLPKLGEGTTRPNSSGLMTRPPIRWPAGWRGERSSGW